jgi:hypothetical protein
VESIYSCWDLYPFGWTEFEFIDLEGRIGPTYALFHQSLNANVARWHELCYYAGQEDTQMRTKTTCKAGKSAWNNHSETLVRETRKNLKVRTAVRAGALKR